MKLIILDRDGVINYDSDQYIKYPEEWLPIPGSLEAIASLKKAGYTIAVASNQSGIGRGLYDVAMLDAMHQKMQRLLADVGGSIDAIFYCPHHPDDGCDCRKPQPGLLLKIAKQFNCDLTNVPYVGDKCSDIAVARVVGCQPVLVKTGYAAQTLASCEDFTDVWIFDDLAAFAKFKTLETHP